MENDNSNPPRRRSMVLGGGQQTLAIVLVLLLVIAFARRGDPSLGVLSLLAVLGIGFYLYFRLATYLLGRPGPWVATITLILAVTWFGVVQYQAFQQYDKLVERLTKYDEITIRQHGILGTSPIAQISFTNDIDDETVEQVIAMPELAKVSYVYLKAKNITDRGLKAVSHLNLEYIYVASPDISDEAIDEFQESHPKCAVIVPSDR